jgi:hypothetical protein
MQARWILPLYDGLGRHLASGGPLQCRLPDVVVRFRDLPGQAPGMFGFQALRGRELFRQKLDVWG